MKTPRLPLRQVPELKAILERMRALSSTLAGAPVCSLASFDEKLESLLKPFHAELLDQQEDWQDRVMTRSYLEGRKSLGFYSNTFYLMENHPEQSDLFSRASHLIQRVFAFRSLVLQGKVPEEIESSYRLDQSFFPFFSHVLAFQHIRSMLFKVRLIGTI